MLIALSVAEIEAAQQWYETVLGFKEVRRLSFPESALEIRFLELDGFRVELMDFSDSISLAQIRAQFSHVEDRAKVQGFNKLALSVPDLDAFARELDAKGVKLAAPITRDEATHERYLLLDDADGNWIQVFEVK